MAITALVLVAASCLLLRSASLHAVLEREAVIYMDDRNGPSDLRSGGEVVPAGEALEIVECIDTKSDRYIRVVTPSGVEGYLYDLDFSASFSFSISSYASSRKLLGCALFL